MQTGSTLTINALITGTSSSKTLTLTGGGVFNYGGNPYAPSNIVSGQLPFKATFTITNDSTCNLSGVISNGSANAVLLTTSNSVLNETVTGSIQGNVPLTINSGLATLRGTNNYTNLTTIVGPNAMLQVFGRQALSGASSLAQGGSTSFNSTLALATADSYTMNQLQLTGIIIVTNSGAGASTLTFTNGGFQTGTATKQITVSSNTTVVIGGANFDIIGVTANKNRNVSLTPDTGGVITFNAVLRDNGAFQGGVEKHGHGIVNLNAVNTYTGGTTNSGNGKITVTTNLAGATPLALGDKFKIFSQAVSNGAAMTIAGALPAGLAWQNDLAVDGSISVVSGSVSAPVLTASLSGNVLTFTWAGSFKLQLQTNSLSTGLNNTWFDFPGGNISGVTATINPANPTVFYRLSQ